MPSCRPTVSAWGKTGSHEARFAFPALPPAFREQANLIAPARKSRNVAMYDDPGRVSDSFATAVIQTARQRSSIIGSAEGHNS
jgi:hypothetical protein